MNDTTIDLTPFCANESSRYGIDKPFVQDGYLCATDGRIAIRIPSDAPDSEDKYPPVRDVIVPKQETTDADWQPWPADAQEVRGMVKCEACKGERHIGRVDCSECKGYQETECPTCNQMHPCDECNGRGHTSPGTPCTDCDAKGEVDGVVRYRVGPAGIATKYYRLIAALPNVRYYCPDKATTTPCWFRFDGGEGAVMRLNVGDE